MKTENQNINVVVRCRPMSATEKKQGQHSVVDVKHDKITVKERLSHSVNKTYTFDKVFDQKSTQIKVYKDVVVPAVDEVLQGYNCTIFAYGQTGTGKTFTMEGERSSKSTTWEDDEMAGIVPRSMHQLFERLESTENCEFSVRASYMEIYNEEIVDLLGAENIENPRLRIYEDKKGACAVNGLEEAVIVNKDQIYKLLRQGAEKRQTASTLMNARSSRSHSVFIVTIHIKENSVNGEELLKIGKLNLVDLAGSECIGKSGAMDKRAREAGNINQSLLTLGRVITALVDHAPHIPYRESKLTRLLQDSLGGRTKTVIIGTITPSSSNVEETLCTLDYVNRAKNILNRPEINQRLSKKTLIREYTDEIERLRKDLQACRDKNGFYVSEDNYMAMQGKIENQSDNLTDMEDRLKTLNDDLKKMTELFSDTNDELTNKMNEVQRLNGDLKLTVDHLQVIRSKLSKTRQERDEQLHLVSHQRNAHQQLYGQAEDLRSTADLATEQVSALHDRLDKTTHALGANRDLRRRYAQVLEADTKEITTAVENFRKRQNHQSEVASSLIEQTTEERKLSIENTINSVNSLLELCSENITNHNEDVNNGCSLASDKIDQQTQLVDEQRKSGEELVGSEMNSILNGEIMNFKRQITSMQEKNVELEKLLKENEKERKGQIDTFVGMLTSNLKRSQGHLDDFVVEQQRQFEGIHLQQASRRLAQSESRKKLLQAVQQQLREDEDSDKAFDAQFDENMEIIEKNTKENNLSCSENLDLCKQFMESTDNLIEKNQKVEQNCLVKRNEDLDYQSVINDDLHSAIVDFMSSKSEQVVEQKSELDELAKTIKESLSESASLIKKNQMIRHASVVARVENLCFSHSDDRIFQDSVSKIIATNEETISDIRQFCDNNNVAVEELHEHYTDHVGNLYNVESTGLTPSKTTFDYPRKLTSNPRHSLLLSDFRQSYDVLNDSMSCKFLDSSIVEDSNEISNDSSDDKENESQVKNKSLFSQTKNSSIQESDSTKKVNVLKPIL